MHRLPFENEKHEFMINFERKKSKFELRKCDQEQNSRKKTWVYTEPDHALYLNSVTTSFQVAGQFNKYHMQTGIQVHRHIFNLRVITDNHTPRGFPRPAQGLLISCVFSSLGSCQKQDVFGSFPQTNCQFQQAS